LWRFTWFDYRQTGGEIPMTRHRPANTPRYAIRAQTDGMWSIIDLFTSLPAATNGKDLAGLEREDAEDIARELNRSLIEGKDSPLV
jgi:hypothetical protein